MISLIWFILSLCNVCNFSWWPVLIEGILFCLIFIIQGHDVVQKALGFYILGTTVFAGLKLFCGLTLSPWWILLSGIWFVGAVVVPGGFSLTYLLFKHLNVIIFSKSLLMVLIIFDIMIFAIS